MKEQFNATQISKVIDQALVYQCACPAQVCKAIFELRELFDYQMNCASDTKNDILVHKTIAAAAEISHEIMEECLKKILEIVVVDARRRRAEAIECGVKIIISIFLRLSFLFL